MSPKAQLVSYVNVFIFFALVFANYVVFFLFSNLSGEALSIIPFLFCLLLVFVIWGVVNAIRYLQRKNLSVGEYILLSVPLINLVLLLMRVREVM